MHSFLSQILLLLMQRISVILNTLFLQSNEAPILHNQVLAGLEVSYVDLTKVGLEQLISQMVTIVQSVLV